MKEDQNNKDIKKVKKAKKTAIKPSIDDEQIEKYARGNVNISTSNVKSLALKSKLQHTKDSMQEAAISTAATEVLLPADPGFIEMDDSNMKVFKLKQKDILDNVDLNTSKNAFDFQLQNFGPYCINYSRNGRHLIFGGRKGHVATYDCHTMTVGTELQLQQEVYDVQYLHNETMFAVAQKKYAYIYDQNGVEIHCMKRHERPLKLDYLPYHFLLVSAGHSGWIKWHDISIGDYIAGFNTGFGPIRALKQNPFNAVMNVGHSNGVVSMWAPSAGKALVSMLCHKAPITDIAIDREGTYMATAALDGYLKIWDLRKLSHVHCYKLAKPASSIDISERGLIGVGMGRSMQVLRHAFNNPMDVTYLNHEIRTPNAALSSGAGATAATRALLSNVSISNVEFRPLEDVLCAGHSHGVTAIIVPGSGEPNFDSFENNPFITSRQRREADVQNLLNKLSPDIIGLDNTLIGSVEKDQKTLQEEHNQLFYGANQKEAEKKEKNRKRGRNKISAKLRRKQKNVVDDQVVKLKQKQREQREAAEKAEKQRLGIHSEESGALSRFAKK